MNDSILRFQRLGGPPIRHVMTTHRGTTALGRDAAPGISLPDQRVSRRHAVISTRDGRWSLTDLGSHNGTRLNAVPLTPHLPVAMGPGDTLGIGPWLLRAVPARPRPIERRPHRALDAERLMRMAFDLPERIARLGDEAAVLDVACTALVSSLQPFLTFACAFVLPQSRERRPQVIAMCDRGDAPRLDDIGHEGRARVSRRAIRQACRRPGDVVLLRRAANEDPDSRPARHVFATQFDRTTTGRAVVLYATADQPLDAEARRISDTIAMVAVIARQQMTALRHARLGRCFSPGVIRLLTKRGGSRILEEAPRTAEATSMFFDLRGFSRCAESVAMHSVHADLRRIMSMVTQEVFALDGTVVDYAGDGLFAAWGVPFPRADQTDRAVRCAIRIVRRLADEPIGVFAPGAGSPRVPCGIGIDRGTVLAGAAGSPEQPKYGVFGPSVNAAARLEALTKPDRLDAPILMTGTAFAALQSPKSFNTRSRGRVKLSGMEREVGVVEVLRNGVDSSRNQL